MKWVTGHVVLTHGHLVITVQPQEFVTQAKNLFSVKSLIIITYTTKNQQNDYRELITSKQNGILIQEHTLKGFMFIEILTLKARFMVFAIQKVEVSTSNIYSKGKMYMCESYFQKINNCYVRVHQMLLDVHIINFRIQVTIIASSE